MLLMGTMMLRQSTDYLRKYSIIVEEEFKKRVKI